MKNLDKILNNLTNPGLKPGLQAALLKDRDVSLILLYKPTLNTAIGRPPTHYIFEIGEEPSTVFNKAFNNSDSLLVTPEVLNYIVELNKLVRTIIDARNYKWALNILRDNTTNHSYLNDIAQAIVGEDILEETSVFKINEILNKLKDTK